MNSFAVAKRAAHTLLSLVGVVMPDVLEFAKELMSDMKTKK